jgi:hypothetical protein
MVLLSSLALAACKGKPDLPPTLDYLVQSKDLSLVGVTLVSSGQRAPFERMRWNSDSDIARATVKLPRTGPSLLGSLELELTTPCGTKKVPLKVTQTAADEEKVRGYGGPFYVDVEGKVELPPRVDVWVDAEPKAKIQLGTAELGAGKTALFDPACSATSPVKAGGNEIGTFTPPADPKKESVFITTRKDVCYSLEFVVYSKRDDGGGSARLLRGAQVYTISSGDIEYFLRKAPSSVQTSSGTPLKTAQELVAVPCP